MAISRGERGKLYKNDTRVMHTSTSDDSLCTHLKVLIYSRATRCQKMQKILLSKENINSMDFFYMYMRPVYLFPLFLLCQI